MAAFRPQESSSLFLDVKMGGGGGGSTSLHRAQQRLTGNFISLASLVYLSSCLLNKLQLNVYRTHTVPKVT